MIPNLPVTFAAYRRAVRHIVPTVFTGLVILSIGSAAASSPIVVPKYTASTNGWLSGNLLLESHLPVALFQWTNAAFDEKVYESVRKAVKPPMIISFHLITFVFSSPSTNDLVFSFCEMDQPHQLICTGTKVSRRPGSTNEIPLNRVSAVDRHKQELTADLDLLLGIAPLNDPQDVRYFKRSFHFVYRDGWKED